MSASEPQPPPFKQDAAWHIGNMRAALKPKHTTYEEGWDDALCWVLDLLDLLHADNGEEVRTNG